MITALPTPVPTRQDPSNFSERADAFLSALPAFGTEANALATEVNQDSTEAAASALTAVNSANAAMSSANFKGSWSDLTGALNIPASVFHNSAIWLLLNNLVDVTTAVPGVSASWLDITQQPPTPFDNTVALSQLHAAILSF